MASKSSSSSGIGLTGVLFVVFLVLKLTGNIDWSWWWVTSPLWIPIAIALSTVLIIFIIFMLFISLGFDFEVVKEKIENLTKKIR
jgi:membrane protein YdbS with pleckstrin-like domain